MSERKTACEGKQAGGEDGGRNKSIRKPLGSLKRQQSCIISHKIVHTVLDIGNGINVAWLQQFATDYIDYIFFLTFKSCHKVTLPFYVHNLRYSDHLINSIFVFLYTFHFFELPKCASLALLANPYGHSG